MAQPKRYEIIFAVIGLMFFAGTFSHGLGVFLPGRTDTLLRYGITAGSIVFLCQRWRGSLLTALRGGWIWGTLLLLGTSFLWSRNPAQVLTNIRGELIPMLCLSLYIASRFTLKEQLRIVAWSLGLSMLLSILLVFTMPSIGIHTSGPHTGAWKGVFVQKNVFGAHSVLTSAVFFVLTIHARKRKGLMLGFFLACIIAILLSTSKTALLLSIIGILVVLFYENFRWTGTKSILMLNIATLITGVTAGVLSIAWGPILRALGRDPTLTGRTLIWTFLIEEKIPSNALVGYGRNIFWSAPQYFGGIYDAAHHVPSNAHNGFIDLILDVGFLGLFFFVLAWIFAYIKAVKLAYSNKEAAYIWPAVFLTLLLLNNVMESVLARQTNIFWVLFVSLAFTLNKKSIASELQNI